MRAQRPWIWPTLMTLAALGVLVSLGVWQLQRSEWKTALIAAVEARMASAPLTLEAALAGGLTDAEFRKVRIAGVFDHAKELRLFTQRLDEGVGYAILTPLTRADGATLLVERGFVPQVLAEPSARKEGQAEGVVTVTGWIRLKDEPRWLTPADEPGKRVFFHRDPEAMARTVGVDLVAPVILVADATANPGGWPKGGMSLSFLNNHFGYAITWFGLALALLGVYAAYMWGGARRN